MQLYLGTGNSKTTNSPQNNNIFKESEENEDDANTHPDIESRDVADPGGVLPHGAEHGGQGEQGGHGHGHPPRDRLGRQEERQPSHDHEQPCKES